MGYWDNYTETPMRPQYQIKDPEMVELVKNIFTAVDQAWWDGPAFDVAKLIQDFVDSKIHNSVI